jgi:hypothetical protein
LNSEEKALPQEFDHRLSISDRYPEISLDDMGHEMEILDIKGFVQAILYSDGFNEFLIGLLPGQKHSRVSRNHVKEKKGDQ